METVKKLLKTSTLRQSSITFSGSLINGALGAVFFILVARQLGPANFGLLSITIAVATYISDIADLGTDTGLVRFVGKYLKKHASKSYKFLKLSIEVKIIVSAIVAVLGLFISKFIAQYVFHKPGLTFLLQISFIGVVSSQLFSFTTHALQSFQKFWHWSGLYIFTNSLRLLLILFFVYLGTLTSTSVLVIYIAMPFLGFLAGAIFLPTKKYLSAKNELSVGPDFFHYNKWVAAFTLVAATSSRLDTFISARLLDEAQVGIYSASNQLVQFVPQLVGALGTVIAPKMSEMGTIKEFKAYLIKTQLLVSGIAGAGLIGIPIAQIFIPFAYGQSYQGSVPIFVILLISMLIFLMSVPIHNSIFYYFAYPRLFFWLSLGHLFIILVVGWSLISSFGAIGAAVAVLIGMVFNFVVPAFWVLRKLQLNGEK